MKRLFCYSLLTLAVGLTACSHKERGTVNSEVKFSHSATDIDSICNSQQKILESRIDAIAKAPVEKATFENTVLAIEAASATFSNEMNPVLFLKYVSDNEGVRTAADKCETAVEQLLVDLFAREDLFLAVKSVKEKGETLDEKGDRLLTEYLQDFERNGLTLTPDKRKIFLDKKKELVALESEFSKNLNEWKDHLELTRAELDGLDDAFIDGLEKTPAGKYKVTLAYPHYYPFMDNAKNASARQALQLKFYKRGGARNTNLLEKAIRLRHEMAQMLGKKTHAHFVLEKRMAKTPEEVSAFLDELATKLKPKGEADLQEFVELKRKELNDPSIQKIESYDWRYYANQLKKQKHQIDNQEIKKYFPLNVVVGGMFDIYQTLLGVTFVEDKSGPKWHDSVTLYEVKQDGETVARFYMDLFPREGKYGHAAAFTLVSGYQHKDGAYQMPVSSIVANFNAPTADTPSLLSHNQVETLFHEFGHIMHQVLTKAKYATFSGTSVKRDFVEAPSQMLENWCWEKESLEKLSGHYKDNSKKLPDDLIKKLVAAKLASSGVTYLRQVMFAKLDMIYHTNPSVDSTKVYQELARDVMLIPIPDGTIPQASFGHLMGGYDAGYYGYLWSEVFAADMYTRFEKAGLLDPATGRDYRKWILEPGGEQNPMDLITQFLGRAPNQTAFLKSIGL